MGKRGSPASPQRLIERLAERAARPLDGTRSNAAGVRVWDEDAGAFVPPKASKKDQPSPRERFPPVTEKTLKAAEKKLGFALPQLLRDVYLEVANGGIGPGNSLLCLKAPTRDIDDLVTRYLTQITEVPPPPFHPWPARFLTIGDLGCNITFELDWQDPAGPVYELDMNAGDPEAAWEDSMRLDAPSLAEWFESWLREK